MDRLQKKCFIVTGAGHGLLVLVLLFGSALMPAKDESNAHLLQVFDLTHVTDGPTTGGNPNVTAFTAPPAAANPAPKTQSTPPPAPEPKHTEPPPSARPPEPVQHEQTGEPPKVRPNPHTDIPRLKPVKTHEPKNRLSPDELKLSTTTPKPKATHHHPTIDPDSLKPVTRRADDRARAEREAQIAEEKAAERAAERAAHERQQRFAKLFSTTMRSLGKGLSSTTLVEMPGPGGGGALSANYRDVIASTYYNAWNPPAYLDQDAPIVVVTITIGSDGSVTGRIIKRSGVSVLDKSVERALENVTYIDGIPASAANHPITIQFNLQAKRQIG